MLSALNLKLPKIGIRLFLLFIPKDVDEEDVVAFSSFLRLQYFDFRCIQCVNYTYVHYVDNELFETTSTGEENAQKFPEILN